MESNKIFALLASSILGISVSLFLSDLSFLRRLFPFIFGGIRAWIVIFEVFFAYLTGSLLIATRDEDLDIITKKKILNLLLIAGIAALIISIGVKSFSFKYLNISSFTIIVLALIYCTINPGKLHLKTSFLILIGGSFFVIALLGMPPNYDTNLEKVMIAGYERSGDIIQLDIETTICQKENYATDICIEMIFLEGYIEKNAEYIKVVNFLDKGDKSVLHWKVNLPAKNEEHTLYLYIWSELEEKQYKIKIPRDIKVGDSLSIRELTFGEYLKVFYLELKKIFESDKSCLYNEIFCNSYQEGI